MQAKNMQTPDPTRRTLLRAGLAIAALPGIAAHSLGSAPVRDGTSTSSDDLPDGKTGMGNDQSDSTPTPSKTESEGAMQIQYLEIVTKDVNAVCATYAKLHGVTFGDGDPRLGGARTAALPDGGLLGVRAPMHEAEEQVVRPYLLVDDIESAVAAAVESGAEIAHPPMKLPGHGTFAIFIQGGINHGLWQV
jgi:uncharacterized protein